MKPLTVLLVLVSALAGYLLHVILANTPVDIDDRSPKEWLDVSSVTIANSPYGVDPLMKVERTIRKPFQGDWTVVIRDTDGGYWCAASGRTNYELDAKLPDEIRLFKWWMFARGKPESLCYEYPLFVGCYVAVTTWEWKVESGRIKTERAVSNTFCVTAQ